MKKSTLALAVAAALTGFGSVAQADTTLYGSARVSVDWVDIDMQPDEYWDVFDNASRLGVRGLEDLGGGLSAIYQFEFGVDVTDGGNFVSNRPKWVGLKGGFGSVTAGTQWSAYYNAVGVADIFNSARAFASNTGYLGGAFGHRLDNTVMYTSPNMSGFTAQAMLVMNGTQSSIYDTPPGLSRTPDVSDGIDMWHIAANYSNGPFYAGAAFMQLQNTDSKAFSGDDAKQWALVGAYKPGPFSVGLLYEQGDLNLISASALDYEFSADNNLQDAMSLYLFGSYTFGNNEIKAAYGYMEPDGHYYKPLSADPTTRHSYSDIQNLILSYQYNLSKRTRLWVEYLGRMDDNDGKLYVIQGDQNVVSIGTRHDF